MGTTERIIALSGLFVAIGGGSMSAFASVVIPQYAQMGFWGGLLLLFVGSLMLIWAVVRNEKREATMSGDSKEPIIGLDIQGGQQKEPAAEFISTGTAAAPSIGGEVYVHVPAGQSAIGTRVIQNGPGTGMRVVQNGPGIGFKSIVVVGKPPEDKK